MRLLPPLTAALAALLLVAAPATAGGLVQLDGSALRFTGSDDEPSNVTIADAGGQLTLEEDASRMTAGPGCSASAGGYRVTCPDLGVARIEVQTGNIGSDVRILATLPADIRGGAGDDLLIGGPMGDRIDGGAGSDVIGGGGGADVLRGGPGPMDLVTYEDRIGPAGTLLPRRGGVRIAVGVPDASGAPGEDDTIAHDVEQVQGGAGADRFLLRDGLRTSVDCGAGRDRVQADGRDDVGIDCESTTVAPQRGGARLTVPTLVFPFTSSADRGTGVVRVLPVLPLQRGAVLVRVSCPVAIGLLDIAGPGCAGRVRFARGRTAIAVRRIANIGRGHTITLRLPLSSSRGLARRRGGLPLTVTAQPGRGRVQRTLAFTVRG